MAMVAAHNKMFNPTVMWNALWVTWWSFIGCVAYALISKYVFGVTPTTLEFIGTIANISCGWLVRRQNIWNWAIATVGVTLQGIVFWQAHLVGQAGLSLFYFIYQFWCWYIWLDHSKSKRIQQPIRNMTGEHWLFFVAIYILGTLALGPILSLYDGVFVYLDGSIVAASLVAQYFLATKRTGNWLIWILPVNVAAIVLYASTGLYMIAALYVFYLWNAVMGYRDWRKEANAGMYQSANIPLVEELNAKV